MAKLTLTDITSGYDTATVSAANNLLIKAAVENTLSRDGTSPNQMEAVLDMNSYAITNLPNAVNNQSPVTLAQAASIQSFTGVVATSGSIGAVLYPQTAWEIAAGTTPTDYTYPAGNVLRYGADPTGVADSTAAFNLATRSDYSSTGNTDLGFAQEVIVPGGDYLLSGSVYIHKGQHLHGAGAGATRIDLTGALNLGDHVFKLGVSEGDVADSGGLAPEISELWMRGGPTGWAGIFIATSGCFVHDLFLSAVTTGIYIRGTGTVATNIIIDNGSVGIKMSGHSHLLSNIHLYIFTGASIKSTTTEYSTELKDCLFSNIRIYYPELKGIQLIDGVDCENLLFDNCMFYLNEQYAGFAGFVSVECDSADNIRFSDCSFTNMKGGAVIDGAGGLNNELIFNDCIFEGNKTVDVYNQSTTAYAAFVRGSKHRYNNCEFKNLLDEPIWVFPETAALTHVHVNGGIVENCSGTELIDISAGTPVAASMLYTEGVRYVDQQKQPFVDIAGGWFMGGDGHQVLVGNGATTIAQYPTGRNSIYFVNTSASAASVRLPKTSDSIYVRPKNGDRLTFIDYNQDWATNNVTFLAGDNTINNVAADYVAATAGDTVTFRFNGATLDWSTTEAATPSEIVTATNVITAAESGKTFYLNAAGGFTSTLPAPAVGLKYKFIVKTAPTTAYIVTTNAGANVLYGALLDIVGEQVAITAQDTITFVANTSLIGDSLEVESDGTNWYVTAKSLADGGITVSVT